MVPGYAFETGLVHCGWVKDESRSAIEYWCDQGERVVVKPVKYNQRFKSLGLLIVSDTLPNGKKGIQNYKGIGLFEIDRSIYESRQYIAFPLIFTYKISTFCIKPALLSIRLLYTLVLVLVYVFPPQE
jgi:hypothetical protein